MSMIETDQLREFINTQERKLQAKIYARKYERLAGEAHGKAAIKKLPHGELIYHYRPNEGVWVERSDQHKIDNVLATYELKFLR